MWSIRKRLAISWIEISVFIWVITFGLQAWIGKTFDVTAYGCVIAIVWCCVSIAQQNTFQMLRTVCPSTATAWREHIFLILTFTLANFLVYVTVHYDQFGTTESQQIQNFTEIGLKSPLLLTWLILWILLLSIWPKMARATTNAPSRKNILKGIGLILLLYFYLILASVALGYSPLLGCLCSTLPLGLAIYWNPLLKQTLQPDLRRRITLLLSIGIMLFGFISYGIALETKDYSFVGELRSRKGWKFEDLQNVKKIEDWAQWVESADRKISAEETIQSVGVLQSICEEQPSDDVGTVVCAGKLDHSINFRIDRSEADVVSLLKSENPIAQRLGIFCARSLRSPSAEINALISGFQDNASPLALAAKNTLSENKNNLSRFFRIHIKKKTEK